ncbi:MAG TPA: aminotransferase class V-fold PLP-dependent enzyme [Mycobacterium sp.]|nr:aminotransferase class V-fold PLP-dependent enzyme [Mycobacterium sp.]
MTTVTAVRTPAQFRAEFPVLDRVVHLASCSLGARSAALDAALGQMLAAMSAGSAAWSDFEQQAQGARQRFAALIGAHQDQVAIVPNASIGAYQVASTLMLGCRDRVITTSEEFPSIAHVWLAQRPRGVQVGYADGGGGPVDAGHYRAAVDDHTALVSVPLVTYEHGRLLPVSEVAALAHARGARVFVDAYQAVGVLPVDVAELGCDYLVAGTCKYLLGLPGVAFLYVRDGVAGGLDPSLTGWFGRTDPFAFNPRRLDFPATARRFETGIPAVPALYAANAGLDLIAGLDLHEVQRHVTRLIELATQELTAQGERLPDAAAAHGAHIGLTDTDAPALAAWLGERGIAVSPRGSVTRLSFHYFNDEHDVEQLCAALRQFRSLKEKRLGYR